MNVCKWLIARGSAMLIAPVLLMPGLLQAELAHTATETEIAQAQQQDEFAQWFEEFKISASDRQLYEFLYHMPKGGDLHNHLSGSAFPDWWYRAALDEAERGYEYYTKVRIQNCLALDEHSPPYMPYYLLYRNITALEYERLNECEKSEYKPLADLSPAEINAWQNSLRLDKPTEGRHEFFETHWQRLNALFRNPHLMAEMLYQNMRAFSQEGVLYLETQISVEGLQQPSGEFFSAEEVADIYRARLAQEDALATGVEVRFQLAILRFSRSAEEDLKRSYEFIHNNPDRWVAINMVGREDNDKGHPLRFLSTLRELRRKFFGVNLSIHAGEVDEPNHHVRDTLLLGAQRIGHGVNLISDPDTLLLMRNGPYLVEINLVSNLLLEYVSDYSQHPFPEYLRLGVPVALSTDDRGMWDSQITDEFFVAVKEYDLSWPELQQLHRNSLQYAFVSDAVKQTLLDQHQTATQAFSQSIMQMGLSDNAFGAAPSAFICRTYNLCEEPTEAI
ncbi:adenosine deaminase family protein [Halioxenophilus aromaticivorans]|uniref:Adenosine deaminase domain-containing protein n=1 Tax=Halioxenophilus aromaticivorans TaxID=1306992 RepID=A0AAV3U9J6_9ALTE